MSNEWSFLLLSALPGCVQGHPGRKGALACHMWMLVGPSLWSRHPTVWTPSVPLPSRKSWTIMLEKRLVKPAQTKWYSAVTLALKLDGSYWLWSDYRKFNQLAKIDSHPLPKDEDCINRVGRVKCITKFQERGFGLMSGYRMSHNLLPRDRMLPVRATTWWWLSVWMHGGLALPPFLTLN